MLFRGPNGGARNRVALRFLLEINQIREHACALLLKIRIQTLEERRFVVLLLASKYPLPGICFVQICDSRDKFRPSKEEYIFSV